MHIPGTHLQRNHGGGGGEGSCPTPTSFLKLFFIFIFLWGRGIWFTLPTFLTAPFQKRCFRFVIHYLSGYSVFGDVPRRRAQTTTTTTTMTRITITAMTIPAIAPPSKPSSDDTTDVMKKKDSCTL